jgi:hypothetical protein
MKSKFFFSSNFQIFGPLGCQGWVVIPQNVKKPKSLHPTVRTSTEVQSPCLTADWALDFHLYIFLLQSEWVRDGPKTDEPPSQKAHIGPFYTDISLLALSSRVPYSSFELIISTQKSGKKFTFKRQKAKILTAYLRVRTRHAI